MGFSGLYVASNNGKILIIFAKDYVVNITNMMGLDEKDDNEKSIIIGEKNISWCHNKFVKDMCIIDDVGFVMITEDNEFILVDFSFNIKWEKSYAMNLDKILGVSTSDVIIKSNEDIYKFSILYSLKSSRNSLKTESLKNDKDDVDTLSEFTQTRTWIDIHVDKLIFEGLEEVLNISINAFNKNMYIAALGKDRKRVAVYSIHELEYSKNNYDEIGGGIECVNFKEIWSYNITNKDDNIQLFSLTTLSQNENNILSLMMFINRDKNQGIFKEVDLFESKTGNGSKLLKEIQTSVIQEDLEKGK